MKQGSWENITSANSLGYKTGKSHNQNAPKWGWLHDSGWEVGMILWGETGPREPLLRSQSFLSFTQITWLPVLLKLFSTALYWEELLFMWHDLAISSHVFIRWQTPVSWAMLFPLTLCNIRPDYKVQGCREDRPDYIWTLASGLTLILTWHNRHRPAGKLDT